MNNNHDIVTRVQAAKGDPNAADTLIKDYMPFIKSETYKAVGRLPVEGADDELSVAMFAFYEAIESYSKLKGAFLNYAALHIKHKIIDFQRKEKRHKSNISINEPVYGDESESTLGDTLKDGKDELASNMQKNATNQELAELSQQLSKYDLSLSDVADNCPKQDRTFTACIKAIEYVKQNPHLIDEMIKTGKLPLAALTAGANVERKTLERHRKYIMAVMIIYSNGYEIIRGHLTQISSRVKGGATI